MIIKNDAQWGLINGYDLGKNDEQEPEYVQTIISSLNSEMWKLKYPLNVEVQFLENNVVIISSLDLGIVVSGNGLDYAIDLFRERADVLILLLENHDEYNAAKEWLDDINEVIQAA